MYKRPAKELINIISPAYKPCSAFEVEGACSRSRWDPPKGHIPRGFVGATGSIDDIELILVAAEPGFPHPTERYQTNDHPEDLLEAASKYAYLCMERKKDIFHFNTRYFLDTIYPGFTLDEQMKKVWFVDAYLCSAEKELGPVPAKAILECTDRYLKQELELLQGRPIVAFGRKAQERVKSCILRNRIQYNGLQPNVIDTIALAAPRGRWSDAKDLYILAAQQAIRAIGHL